MQNKKDINKILDGPRHIKKGAGLEGLIQTSEGKPNRDNTESQDSSSAVSQNSLSAKQRVSRGIEADPEIFRKYKIVAARTGKKQYELMEEALLKGLEQYKDLL